MSEAGDERSGWIARVERSTPRGSDLKAILPLHYRYRFEPAGLSAGERQVLTAYVRAWLSQPENGDAQERSAAKPQPNI